MNLSELRSQLGQLHNKSFGWALHCCSNDRMMAEEALQTTYLKILEGKATFHGRSGFRTWLFAVIRHTAIELYRKKRWGLFFSNHEEQEMAVEAEDPHTEFDRNDLEELFRGALQTLSERQRGILHLVFYQDMTLSEAAAVLGISLGSARTHYERGKRNIRRWMEESNVVAELRS
ncbi:MAG: sigma-70 family RNA polymerase sigma factor [Ignavibacteriales bacterium]|nr:sigma-70 family RNA polymerase sigma factor [Ignavibacteriales bacterium]